MHGDLGIACEALVSAEKMLAWLAVDAITSLVKRRCSQCEPRHTPLLVGWFSSSAPPSVGQPKMSRTTEATRGVTSRLTRMPRSVPTTIVLLDGPR